MTTFGQNYITQKEFAEKLYSKKICSDTNYQKLLTVVNNNRLNDPIDFLNYCDKATIVYLNKYSEKPVEYLEQIHKDVYRLLPELTFTGFKFQVVLDSSFLTKTVSFTNS